MQETGRIARKRGKNWAKTRSRKKAYSLGLKRGHGTLQKKWRAATLKESEGESGRLHVTERWLLTAENGTLSV